MRFACCLCWIAFFCVRSGAQDTLQPQHLPEVTIRAYVREAPLLRMTSSIAEVDSAQWALHSRQSPLGALNSIPGVRMEERSPGSYRLSLRGSTLRAPFGVRDVKVYLGDFVLTDGGGNTYLNLLPANFMNRIEVLKGPEGSLYGANTAGVVLIDPAPGGSDSLQISSRTEAGSYGYLLQGLGLQHLRERYQLSAAVSYQRANGYREHSASRHAAAQLWQNWEYKPGASLRAYLLWADLDYETPGALTLAQYEANPRAARPATATLPGAIEQEAGIRNRSFLAGLAHDRQFAPRLRQVTALAGMHTDFDNPFILNYELRREYNLQLRYFLQWSGPTNRSSTWDWINGLEARLQDADIGVYGNRQGQRDSLQSRYRFRAGQAFYFSRLDLRLGARLALEAGFSLNLNGYQYRSQFPLAESQYTRLSFPGQLMPRLAAAWQFNPLLSARASISRGYSPPTLAEIHPAAGIIDRDLRAEQGWNKEIGLRLQVWEQRLHLDFSLFHYRLRNAIASRSDSAGQTFFVNAGGTDQPGLEAQTRIQLLAPRSTGLLRQLDLRAAYALNRFRFRDYRNAAGDYSGLALTGVPAQVASGSLSLGGPAGLYLLLAFSYTDPLPLDDANSAWTRPVRLLQVKAGRVFSIGRLQLELYAGVNNLLDETYSLGPDINALGGRYYNAAAGRHVYGGVGVGF